ncbi:branched-chain amino acid ABC transporter permease [Pseudonocardia sp. KRD-184]|uniref:Branched-chain amino acid ABC transporter permease n=1 Tax=Pseudonocardia oceani TaxID=2792013 RepID=A0ABS6U4Z7_9PSEU|nr:branched-chain amino acid ABC transporter permease [Pseudonocardia oceani]MBW0089860.1 branched-chain amino acid ABC transporter permease [Pseudonocardia oceani]MBW0097448.1 branched-chain amino acid ABC transporter permease [Pseudonocardia oceani]MBW0123772.1 branched-chain amino acid ABC transporter permease [Pseudonocardia oceani]MBW0127063.1 branched-chain amino acid ABC transporter permease [Pseudonocardia oceani]
MSVQTFFVSLQSGIGLGSVYALMALSFTLVYSATGYFHLGIGSFVTLGAVLAHVGTVGLALPWTVTAIGAVVLVAALGVVSERVAVRPLRGRGTNEHFAVMVSTLAFMIVVEALVEFGFGAEERTVPAYLDGPPLDVFGVPVRRVYLVMVVVLAVVALVFELVMRRTEAGRILRAAHSDPTGVELTGVSFGAVVLGTFALAGGLAGLAGVLISPVSFASPFVGTGLLIYGFAAMAIGGFGSFAGAMAGGVLIGLVVAFTPVFGSTNLVDPLVLALVLVVLLLRPTGLLGRRVLRTV